MGEKKEFLQSEDWLHFQEAAGKEIVPFSGDDFSANGIVHSLPLVGKYLYIPRGPQTINKEVIERLITGAKERNVKWIRIEPEKEVLEEIKKNTSYTVVKAPHDMQPREIFKIDITLSEEALLANMKSKTRYNIRLAEKRGVKIFTTREEKYRQAFLDLITATSGRKGITSHPRGYYETFFSVFPEEVCRLFVAEYEGQVLAANLIIFYGDTVMYLHGGSSDLHRDTMAPFLLQWETIKQAKNESYHFHDFGGVKTESPDSSWAGITRFKTGFSPKTEPTLYPGTYDIVLAPFSYTLYRMLQKLKSYL